MEFYSRPLAKVIAQEIFEEFGRCRKKKKNFELNQKKFIGKWGNVRITISLQIQIPKRVQTELISTNLNGIYFVRINDLFSYTTYFQLL